MDAKAFLSPWYIMLIGLPGVGKSSFIEGLRIFEDFEILSTDNQIEALARFNNTTYNAEFSKHIQEAQRRMDICLRQAVEEDMHIIHDQTNMTEKKRKQYLGMIPKRYYRVGIWIKCDETVRKQRLKNRETEGKIIPSHVESNFMMPDKKEGFDDLFELDTTHSDIKPFSKPFIMSQY